MPSPVDQMSFAELVAAQLEFFQNWGRWIGVGAVPVAFQGALKDGEALPGAAFHQTITFPLNFDGSRFFVVGSAPTWDQVLTLHYSNGSNDETIGTLTIHPDKTVTASTNGSLTLDPGTIWIVGPNPQVPGVENFSGTLLGTAVLA